MDLFTYALLKNRGGSGKDGITPLLKETDTHIQVSYDNGITYENLIPLSDIIGPQGPIGDEGLSAYEVAQDDGFIGTETQWLATLSQGAPEYVIDKTKFIDTDKMYVLPDGHIWAYFTKKIESDQNLFNKNDEIYTHLNHRAAYGATQNNVLTETIYSTENKTGSLVSWVGGLVTNYIKIDLSDTNNRIIKITGLSNKAFTENTGGSPIMYFDENKKYIGFALIYSSGAFNYNVTLGEDDSYTLDLSSCKTHNSSVYKNLNDMITNTRYIRFSCQPNGVKTTITSTDIENVEITINGYLEKTDWYDTNLNYTPANYDLDVAILKDTSDDHEIRITNIEKTIGAVNYNLPSYWGSEVNNAIASIKAKQKKIGVNCINFALCADMHIENTMKQQHCENLGKIAAKVLNECNIPFLIAAGDNNSGAAIKSETPECIYKDIEMQDEILKPVGKERILKILGNHDGVWGQTTTNGTTLYYDRAISTEERFNLFMAPQEDLKRVWGDNGTYYYVDMPQKKARIICLNSQDTEYHVDENYYSTDTPIKNPMKNGNGYEIKQLEWLSNVALDVKDGWNIILTTHIPPTLDSSLVGSKGVVTNEDILRGIITAYCNKNAYSKDTFSVDYTNAKGEIVGIFAGHLHRDAVDTETLPCPIIMITSAGNTPFDNSGTLYSRSYGTANETAFDVVSADTVNKKVYCTRIGDKSQLSGIRDRVIEY